MEHPVQVHCPIYLLTSTERCWKCGTSQAVSAIGTHGLVDEGEEVSEPGDTTELIFLTNVVAMPSAVLGYITERNCRYMKRHSRTFGATYYANTCECGANFGDFYLYSEPGGAFFPDTDEAARAIYIQAMPFAGSLEFDCSYSIGVGEYILRHARRGAT